MATIPTVDLAAFPIIVPHVPIPDEGEHTARDLAVCRAVGAALALPSAITLDGHANYAALEICKASGTGPAVEYRVRVLGFAFGKGSKKDVEYLGVSLVCLDANKQIVAWTEDVQSFEGTPAFWAAVHAGKPPPPPKKASLKNCGLLTFVTDEKPIAITAEIRALVSALVPAGTEQPADAVKKAAAKKAAKKPAAKKPKKK